MVVVHLKVEEVVVVVVVLVVEMMGSLGGKMVFIFALF